MIIILEIKRIYAIHTLEQRFGKVRALISGYNASIAIFKDALVNQRLDINFHQMVATFKTVP